MISSGKLTGICAALLLGWGSLAAQAIPPEEELTGRWEYGLSVRVRPEMRLHEGFQKKTSNEFVGQRTWITLGHHFSDNARIIATLQDSRIWGGQSSSITAIDTGTDYLIEDKAGNTRKIQESATDIREAYFYLENFLITDLSLQLGRQKIVLGDQRLVGHLDWLNTGRSFDAARLTHKAGVNTLQVFASIVQEGNPSEPNQILRNNRSAHDDRRKDTYFAGIYDTLNFGVMLADVYAFSRVDYQANELHTGGIRLTNRTEKNKLPKGKVFDWSIEAAGQGGLNAGKQVEAYAAGVIAGVLLPVSFPLRLGVTFDHASGDNDPNDNKHTTFNNLYHTNHLFYGNADQISWQNMSGAGVDISAQLMPDSWLKLAYGYYERVTGKDGFYAVHGADSKYAAGSGKLPLFHEVDLIFSWQPRKYLSVEAGYSYLYRAEALRDKDLTTRTNADMQFFYLMSTFSL